MLRNQLIKLRVAVRANQKLVIGYIDRNYLTRVNGKMVVPREPAICMFCGRAIHITKEHIVPRWLFGKDTSKFFNITLNGHAQTYNKSTVPACQKCNGERLNSLERHILSIFENANPKNNPISSLECENIVRWLEIIDYKFHVMNVSKQFLSPKQYSHVPYLKDFPLYILLENGGHSASKVLANIRFALKRISARNKEKHINSVVVFCTTNNEFHFFHTLNEFIFLEIPQYRMAIFYFYRKTFHTNRQAFEAAIKIIKEVY